MLVYLNEDKTMEKFVLKIVGKNQYIVLNGFVNYGYLFEATQFEDYEVAFDVADELMGQRNIKLEIETVKCEVVV
jgi:hypothetical protein